jgi:TolA protein
MNFVKKITLFFRDLFSKKTDESIKEKDTSKSIKGEALAESNFKIIVLKASNLFYKYLKKFIIFILGLIHTMMQPMIKISKKHPIAFWAAVILHALLLFGLLYANVDRWQSPQQQSSNSQPAPVQAVIIDPEIIEAEQERLKDVEKQKQQKLKNEEKRSETAKKDQKVAEQEALKAKAKKIMAEVQRKAEEAKTKDAEKLAKEAAAKKEQAEAKRIAEEAKAKDAETKRIAEEAKAKDAEKLAKEAAEKKEQAEAKRIAEEAKAKDAETKRIEEEAKAKDAEKLAKEAAEKKKVAEAKAKEAENKAKEAEEKAVVAAKKKELAEEQAKIAQELTQIELELKNQLEAEIAAQQQAHERELYTQLLNQQIQEEQSSELMQKIENQKAILQSAWVNNIQAEVRSNWRFDGENPDWFVKVLVTQNREGRVLNVIFECLSSITITNIVFFKYNI